MQVRLTRKLAEQIDGVDLSNHTVGDIMDLPDRKARLLVAEGWAIFERRKSEDTHLVLAYRRIDDPESRAS